MLGIRISDDMEKTLSGICDLSKRSKTSIVKEILDENLEDLYDYYLAISRIEESKKSGEKNYTLEEAKKALGFYDD